MLEGHVTRPIPMNASALKVQQSLNALPSVGFVMLSNSSLVVGEREQLGCHYLSYFIPHAGRADADAHRGRLGARRWERGDAVRAYASWSRHHRVDRRMNKL